MSDGVLPALAVLTLKYFLVSLYGTDGEQTTHPVVWELFLDPVVNLTQLQLLPRTVADSHGCNVANMDYLNITGD